MTKYKILFTAFALFFLYSGYAQNGFAPGANSDNTSQAIRVHEGALNSGNGIYIGHGSFFSTANTAIGTRALNSSSNSGVNNTAMGSGVLGANTTGRNNTAVGFQGLLVNTSGQDNTAVGSSTLGQNTTGLMNTALGSLALQQCSTGSFNVACGATALSAITLEKGNTAIGTNSQISATGNFNTSVGYNSGAHISGTSNVAIGNVALNQEGGKENVAIGSSTLSNHWSGNANVAIGYNSLTDLTYGSGNVGIGTASVGSGPSINNRLSIQNVIYGINMGTTPGSGSVGIGVMPSATTTARLEVDGILKINRVNPVANPGKKFLWRDANDNLVNEDVINVGNANSCTIQGQIPMVTNLPASGDLGCSIINQVSGNIGIGLGSVTPQSILDINCTNGTSDGHIRLRNLAPNPDHTNYNTLIIDQATGIVYVGSNLNDRQPGTNSLDCNAMNNILKSQKTQIDEQAIAIANQQAEINELKIKLNQLVPGNVIAKGDNFQIVPNPVTGISIINYNIDAAMLNAVFIVYDLQGKMLKKYPVYKNAKEGQIEIYKKDFGNGMYILSLVSNNDKEIESKHFIISD